MIYLKINPEGVTRTQAGVLTPASNGNTTQALKGRQNEKGALSPLRGLFPRPLVAGVAPLPVVLRPFGTNLTPACGLFVPLGLYFTTFRPFTI